MSRAGKSIIRGLEQAVDFAKGNRAGTVTHEVARIPDEVDVAAVRKALGLSQAEFAGRYGFTLDSVRNWEQKRRKPDLAVRAYLTVISRKPDEVRATLTAA